MLLGMSAPTPNIYMYILGQLIFSVYYQRFCNVLRRHSSDIAKDGKQLSQKQNYHSFSAKMKITVKWATQADSLCGNKMKKIRSVC